MMHSMEFGIKESVKYIITNCIDIKLDTTVLIIYDNSTEDLIKYFTIQLKQNCCKVSTWKISVSDRHGEEPTENLCKMMLSVSIILCITKYSLAHTNARRLANEKGIGFLSMPEYNEKMIQLNAIRANYKSSLRNVERVSNILTFGKKVEIISEAGTRLYMDIDGRRGNCCPGFINETYLLGSPPDIESNVAPLEEKTNGILVVDGSITHEELGLIKNPITLKIEKGKITDIFSEDKEQRRMLEQILTAVRNDNALVIGELGIGLNQQAQLCGNMLVDEGTYGCIHFGIGSNWTIGGKNKLDFHLDLIIKKPTLIIDNNVIIKEGELL